LCLREGSTKEIIELLFTRISLPKENLKHDGNNKNSLKTKISQYPKTKIIIILETNVIFK